MEKDHGDAGIPIAKDPFASQWWEFQTVKSVWEDGFCDLLADGEDYERLGTDSYDCSLEIIGATADWRLSSAQQNYLSESGFSIVYINHNDGWETHYTLHRGGLPVRGWRRRYVSDPNAATDRVIAGEPDPGYYEISYWPESWGNRKWRETGYMRIIPDPLDPFAQGMETRHGGGEDPT